jgi:hypothetical protein
MIEMEIKERILGIVKSTDQDILLSQQKKSSSGKTYWTKWIKTSKWNWNDEPTDRQILTHEIVIETDEPEMEFNKKLTIEFHKTLRQKGISYYTYHTGNKSFHIHLFVDGLENIEQYQRKKIKEFIAKEITKDKYKYVDTSNFNNKKMIRVEGSMNIKTNKKSRLFDKFIKNNYKLTDEIIEKTKVNKIQFIDIKQKSNKRFCYVIEEAIKNKFPEGKRNNVLLPNAVAILSDDELNQLAKTQDINIFEIKGWKKKQPKFCCIQLRRYAKEINKECLCKMCIEQGYFMEE